MRASPCARMAVCYSRCRRSHALNGVYNGALALRSTAATRSYISHRNPTSSLAIPSTSSFTRNMSHYDNNNYQSDSYTSGMPTLPLAGWKLARLTAHADTVVDGGFGGEVQDDSYTNTQTTDVNDTYETGPCGATFDTQNVQTTDQTTVQDSSFGGGFRW
ncbi:hypothetical protein DAEQUDRAFT_179426 [Daedalea quercina L-15889]|uniref:Uncharacterized protein n=1 Tax=Daedalea quercina L-15889 TaxID=1314783 RepID=A0A165RE80_9APHY|nr:hypothetical protein DAEQUDRAFT_179426 [Daedalea quercina L-15889]